MNLRKTLETAHGLLQRESISHALIGGFALAAHGINRATADIDFLADGTRREDIIRIMCGNGFVLTQQTPEVLHFTGIGFVDILLSNRPLSQQMLAEAIADNRLNVRVLRVEDLIGLKIQAYVNDPVREHQDKADIQNLIAKHGKLDWNRIRKYADLFGQWPEMERLKKSIVHDD